MKKCQCCNGTGILNKSKLNTIIQNTAKLFPAGAYMILNTDEIAIAVREEYGKSIDSVDNLCPNVEALTSIIWGKECSAKELATEIINSMSVWIVKKA